MFFSFQKVGGQMADAEAKALIHAADKDGNQGIDFNEFAKFWETLHGESDVRLKAFECQPLSFCNAGRPRGIFQD